MSRPAGRFAPSPTGPLHFGSLLAALASYLDAHARGDRWLLRIDDLDLYRNAQGAEDAILAALRAHGLNWDEPMIRQSDRIDRYQDALQQLASLDAIYYCTCSRRDLRDQPVYPGSCRGNRSPISDAAIRIRVPEAQITFIDGIAGPQEERLSASCGDFIIRRRDGLIAYQLATAVDDGSAEIVSVVRGGDLLDNTARQIYLMQRLGLTPPAYAHLPMLTQPDGAKLSKQTHAPALDNQRPVANLLAVFGFLALYPPPDAGRWTPADLLAWGVENWDLKVVQGGSAVFRH